MPTLAEATAALGLPAPSTGAPVSVEHPIATADCGHCGTKPIGFFTLKADGQPPKYCDTHRAPGSRRAPAMNETPIATSAAGDDFVQGRTGEAETLAPVSLPPSVDRTAPHIDDQVDVEQLLGQVGDSDEVLVDEGLVIGVDPALPGTDRAVTTVVAPPSPTSGPNGSAVKMAPLSHLRAERERLTAYLQELDRRIEEAVVFEQLAGKTPSELQQLLDDARRQARLCEIALQGVA